MLCCTCKENVMQLVEDRGGQQKVAHAHLSCLLTGTVQGEASLNYFFFCIWKPWQCYSLTNLGSHENRQWMKGLEAHLPAGLKPRPGTASSHLSDGSVMYSIVGKHPSSSTLCIQLKLTTGLHRGIREARGKPTGLKSLISERSFTALTAGVTLCLTCSHGPERHSGPELKYVKHDISLSLLWVFIMELTVNEALTFPCK